MAAKELHFQAYFHTLMAALESLDKKQSTKLKLKKAGLMVGGIVGGTLVLGPIGSVIGGGIAGSHIHGMKSHPQTFAEMMDFLRTMPKQKQQRLVELTETLIGSPDSEQIKVFTKESANKEKLMNLVKNFLIDELHYKVPEEKSKDKKKIEDGGDYNLLNEIPSPGSPPEGVDKWREIT